MSNEARSRVASGKHGHSLISDAKFRRLYALALQLTQSNTGDGLAMAMAGVAADLRSDDGITLEREAGSDFSERVITALSAAVADRMRKNERLTVIVCQRPGTDPILRVAHQLADDAKLPVLFVEDWRKAENGRTAKKASAPLPQRIGAMPVIPVDAEDVIAIYRVAHESMTRAREGNGPTRIQCVLSSAETASNNNGNAVRHLEQWLEVRGLPAQVWRREIMAELQAAKNADGASYAADIQKLRFA